MSSVSSSVWKMQQRGNSTSKGKAIEDCDVTYFLFSQIPVTMGQRFIPNISDRQTRDTYITWLLWHILRRIRSYRISSNKRPDTF